MSSGANGIFDGSQRNFSACQASCNTEAVTHHRSQEMQHGATFLLEKLTLLRRAHIGAHISDDSIKECCRVASLAASSSSSALFESKLLAEQIMKQFPGVSRVAHDKNNQYTSVKTLMDPGAEYNMVSSKVRDARGKCGSEVADNEQQNGGMRK